jgi:transcription elongation factor GreA
MSESPNFLTPEGKERLEKELEALRSVRRPQVAAMLKSAIEEGDLTENAGYDEAKRDQAFLEGRIQEIEAILHSARILESDGRHDIVGIGAQVTVVEVGLPDEETYMIVGPAEADPAKGRISNQSPLGQSLLGRRVGETITVNSPGGVLEFQVRSIN